MKKKDKRLINMISIILAADILVAGYTYKTANSDAITSRIKDLLNHFKNIKSTTTVVEEEPIDEEVEAIKRMVYNEITSNKNLFKINPKKIDDIIFGFDINEDKIFTLTGETQLYTGTSFDSLAIRNLDVNERAVRILESENGFDLVRIEGTNQLGFVSREMIEETEDTEFKSYIIKPRLDYAITNKPLSLYQGPNEKYGAYKPVLDQMELEVLGEAKDGWLLVHLNGDIGFVKKDETTSLLDKYNEMFPDMQLDELVVRKIVESKNNGGLIKKAPSDSSQAYSPLGNYETLRVFNEVDDYYLVLKNGYEQQTFGFVKKDDVTELEGTVDMLNASSLRLTTYRNNSLLLYTPVILGASDSPTTSGHFSIYRKETNAEITPGVVVNYSLPFNGGQFMHDFECIFGKGEFRSHGCARVPLEVMEKLYENSEVGDTVVVFRTK